MKGLLKFITCYCVIISMWTAVYGFKYWQVLDHTYIETFKTKDFSDDSSSTSPLNNSTNELNGLSVLYFLPIGKDVSLAYDLFMDEPLSFTSHDPSIVEVNQDGTMHGLRLGETSISVFGTSGVNEIMVKVTDDVEPLSDSSLIKSKTMCEVLSDIKNETQLVESGNGLIYVRDKQVVGSLLVTSDGDCHTSSTLRFEGNLGDEYTLAFIKHLFTKLDSESGETMYNQLLENKYGVIYFKDLCLKFKKKLFDFSLSIQFMK